MGEQCLCGQELPKEAFYRALDEIIAEYKGEEGALIQVLHGAQNLFGYLPEEVQEYVAKGLGVPVSEVHGVVTFYSYFTMVPRGRHTVKVCLGTACYVRGGRKVLEAIQKELGIPVAGTTEDRNFSLEVVRCIGACGLSPVMTVDDDIYRRVKPAKAADILAKYAHNGNGAGKEE